MLRPISGNISSVITKMTKTDALAPIVALEATVVSGRTYQAYKRGKWDEARERFIEEIMGSITWLCGVAAMNKLGDKLLGKILKKPGADFDVGTDKILRTPFDNFMKKTPPKGFSAKQVALLKGVKILSSILITNLFIGFVVPKLNQALTRKIRHERRLQSQEQGKPAFKGKADAAISAINTFTNCIENTNAGKLISSDIGIAGGRMYNARRKEERREIAIRDLGSIYFYMLAQGHVRNLMNLAETGKATRLNPSAASLFTGHLIKMTGDKDMDVEEFREKVLGKPVELPAGLKFETAKQSAWDKVFKNKPLEVTTLSEVKKVIEDKKIIERADAMSKLQPPRAGVEVLTKQQVIDSMNKAEINDVELLDKVFADLTGDKHKKEFKYVSNSRLYKLKAEMENYAETICKASKDGKVNKKLLEKVRNKNLMYSGINFAAGFVVAAAFLSTFIPKIQYWYTRTTTGKNEFPGTYDFQNNREEID